MEPDANECEQLRQVFFQYADNELSTELHMRFKRHAENCPHCTDALDAEQHLRLLLRRCCQQSAPETLRTQVITRIRQTHIRVERWQD